MASFSNATDLPNSFSGRVRLFPLPNLVLFPHVVQPLHIFEPRYVEMVQEALAGDRLIGMSLLKPGWEGDYEGRPAIDSVACLAKILSWQTLPESRYNLWVVGLRRVRIVRELPPAKRFREAKVEVLEDAYPAAAAGGRSALHEALAQSFESMLPLLSDSTELLEQLSSGGISLGALADVISYALDLNVLTKQALLRECDVDRRATQLLSHLREAADDARGATVGAGFPPGFSMN